MRASCSKWVRSWLGEEVGGGRGEYLTVSRTEIMFDQVRFSETLGWGRLVYGIVCCWRVLAS